LRIDGFGRACHSKSAGWRPSRWRQFTSTLREKIPRRKEESCPHSALGSAPSDIGMDAALKRPRSKTVSTKNTPFYEGDDHATPHQELLCTLRDPWQRKRSRKNDGKKHSLPSKLLLTLCMKRTRKHPAMLLNRSSTSGLTRGEVGRGRRQSLVRNGLARNRFNQLCSETSSFRCGHFVALFLTTCAFRRPMMPNSA
jgi:hypothetical protein